MPELIRDTLLVVAPFKSDGVEYMVGDHVPTRHRATRRVAAAHPEWFAMEYETAELDLAWLAGVEVEAEGRYEAVKRLKQAEEGRREALYARRAQGAGQTPAGPRAPLQGAAGRA